MTSGRMMRDAVIVDVVRTPFGRRDGSLSHWHPVDLAAETLTALVDRTGIDPSVIDDVIMGCVMQVGEQGTNVARNAVLAAEWPEQIPGTTIDRQCGCMKRIRSREEKLKETKILEIHPKSQIKFSYFSITTKTI